MKKKILSLCCVTAMVSTLFTTAVSAAENPFSDIASDSTLSQAVMWAYENGIASGTSDTTFSPDATCTRGQVVTFLWRSQGKPTPASNANPFTDVDDGAYYYDAVLWAVEQGITSGTSGTTFSPDNTCTTAQVLSFLYRANGEPDKTGEGEYYTDAVNWATANGIATSVAPNSQSPRSDIVTYLWKNADAPEMEVTTPEVEVTAPEVEVTTPEVEVTAPESVVYTYNYPEYTVPSSEMEMSWEYFAEINTYLGMSGAENFTFTATGYDSLDELDTTDWRTIRVTGSDYSVLRDPDIRAMYDGTNYSYSTKTGELQVTVNLKYDSDIYDSKAEVEIAKESFLAEISDLVTGFYNSGALKETDSDMVVARYLYDWVCNNVTYGSNTPDPQNAYFTLTYGEGVCMGYAGLINVLYRTAGIECQGVHAYKTDGSSGHNWNYANLDGTWYYIDATFGDTSNNYDKHFAMSDEVNAQNHAEYSGWEKYV